MASAWKIAGGTFPLAGDSVPYARDDRGRVAGDGAQAALVAKITADRIARRQEWARAVPSGWSSHPQAVAARLHASPLYAATRAAQERASRKGVR